MSMGGGEGPGVRGPACVARRDPFVTDFACVERKVVLELDGESHLELTQQDQQRTQWLESEGWLIIRFWDNEIYDE